MKNLPLVAASSCKSPRARSSVYKGGYLAKDYTKSPGVGRMKGGGGGGASKPYRSSASCIFVAG